MARKLAMADASYRALRESVAMTRMDHVHVVRFTGADARAALERLCAGHVRARDGQLQHVLLLREDGRCFADAYILCDDDEFDVLAEGVDAATLISHAKTHVPAGLDAEIADCSRTHVILAVDGPFAWELVSRVAGAESIGLPYLTFFKVDGITCYRAGKTGEFGFGFLVPREREAEIAARLRDAGRGLDVGAGTLEALDQCALENLFFNIRREGRLDATPLELQLQWRVSYDSEGLGVDALRAARARPLSRRLTTLVSPGTLRVGDAVALDGERVGTIANAGWSESRDDCVALALMDIAWAHPGIAGLTIGSASARSVSGPVLNNRSLFVSPQMHSYATRAEIEAPPLVRV